MESIVAEADKSSKTFKKNTENGTKMDELMFTSDSLSSLAKKGQQNQSTLKKLLVPCLLCSIDVEVWGCWVY